MSGTVRRAAVATAKVLLFGWAAVCVCLWAAQTRMMYHPTVEDRDPSAYGLAGVERSALKTPDGETLEVWSAPAQPGKPTVAYFHGNAGNLGHRRDAFRSFQEMGLGVVAVSHRGYGASTGTPRAKALRADAALVLDHMNAEMGIPDGDIIVYGESLGTGLATELAATRDLAGLIIQSGYTSTLEKARSMAPFVPVGLLFTERLDVLGHIGEVAEPVLILHGDRDEIFPIEMARRVGAAARPPVEPVVIPDAGHDLRPAFLAPHIAAFVAGLSR